MPKAILIEPVNLSVSKARHYGTLTVLFPDEDSRAAAFDHESFVDDLIYALNRIDFDPSVDSIIHSGSSLMLSLAQMTILSHFGACRVLYFDAPSGEYIVRSFQSEQGSEHEEEN